MDGKMTDPAKPAPKAKVPKGYDDEAAFLREAVDLFQQDVDYDRENRDEAVADLRFMAGDQWDDIARKAREGRPMLTINDLPAKVAQVVGDMRINKPSIRVRPAEDADQDLAQIREGLIRSIERDCDAQGVYISTGENLVACGIGNFRIALKNSDESGFERDIRVEAIPDSFAVVWDAYSTERTGKDATHCFVVDQVPRKEFIKRFKDALPGGLEVPMNEVNDWYTRDEVRVAEYWRMKDEPATYARLETGATVEVEASPDGMAYAMVRRTGKGRKLVELPAPIMVDEDGEMMVRKGQRRYACMYLITGQNILSGPHELPIPRLPIMRARGWEINVREKRVRFGLIRWARDPARLKNYWRSQSAEMLALAGQGKWLLHESNEGDQDAFRDAHNANDPILVWSGNTAPVFVGPPTINSAVLQESALSAQDMKDVTGLQDASLGARSNETSGKAILARQKEGDVATYIYHDNLQAAISEGGRVINALIPLAYDTARTIRVIGEDDAVKVQRINDPRNPDSVDMNQGRYDVVVETGPSYSTRRVEASESMAQFFQAVPAAAQAAGDLFAKAQDWPMAQEIGERLKKTLPPNLTEGEDDDQSEEAQQAKQQAMQAAQQQQQMQQQDMDLTMQLKQAAVIKAQAEAEKAVNEAQAPPEMEAEPDELDIMLKVEQVRKAKADADKAEWDAKRASVGLLDDMHNHNMRPVEAAMAERDLEDRLNPQPEAIEPV